MTDKKTAPVPIIDPDAEKFTGGPIVIGPKTVPPDQLTEHLDEDIAHDATDLSLDKAAEVSKK